VKAMEDLLDLISKEKRFEVIVNNDYELLVKGNDISVVVPFSQTNNLIGFEEMLSEYKGDINYIVSSDVTGDDRKKLMLINNIEQNTRVVAKVIIGYLSYLGTIAKEIDASITVFIEDNTKDGISIHVGVSNDLLILLLDIHKETIQEGRL
jgi:hypothetical protein